MFSYSAFEIDRMQRTNSFINDVRKVHDENVTDIMSSRHASGATTPKLTDDEVFTKFTFNEKDIAIHEAEEKEKSQHADKTEKSSYKDLVSPMNWKNILQSPRRLKKSFSRSDSNQWTHKPPLSTNSPTKHKPPSLMKSKAVEEDMIVPTLDFETATGADDIFDLNKSQPQLSNRSQKESTRGSRRISQSFQPQQSPRLSQRSVSNSQLDQYLDDITEGRPSSQLSQRSMSGYLEQSQIHQYAQQSIPLSSPLPPHQSNQHFQRPNEVFIKQQPNQAPFINQSPSVLIDNNAGVRGQLNRTASQLSQHLEAVNSDVQLNQQLNQISLSASQLSQQLQHSIQSRLTKNPVQPQIPLAQSPSPFLPNIYQQQHQQASFQPQPQSQPNPVFVQTHLAQQLPQPQLRRHSSVKNNYNPPPSHYESLHSSVTDPPIRSQSQNPNLSHNTLDRSNSAKGKSRMSSPQPAMTDAFKEDRYLYMCLKNRELLLKKIKQCETLESEIKDLKKDDIDHKNT